MERTPISRPATGQRALTVRCQGRRIASPSVSTHAMLCDLLGYDPEDPRPTVIEAARRCPRGEVRAARGPDGQALAVIRLGSGEVSVLPDRCPHDGGPISDGFLAGDRLVCARHQWELDPKTGARLPRHACPALDS